MDKDGVEYIIIDLWPRNIFLEVYFLEWSNPAAMEDPDEKYIIYRNGLWTRVVLFVKALS